MGFDGADTSRAKELFEATVSQVHPECPPTLCLATMIVSYIAKV